MSDGVSPEAAAAAVEEALAWVPQLGLAPPALGNAAAALSNRLGAAANLLEATSRLDCLPLIHEIDETARWLGARAAAVRNASATISAAMSPLPAQLRGAGGREARAAQLAAVVNLRSLRMAALIHLPALPVSAPPIERPVVPTDAATRLLPCFRKGLLDLFANRFESAVPALADACEDLAGAASNAAETELWRSAAEMFAMGSGVASVRVAIIRLTMRLESLLSGREIDGGDQDRIAPGRLLTDLRFMRALMQRLAGRSESAAPICDEADVLPAGVDCVEATTTALHQGASLGDCLRSLRDASLLAERFDLWLEVTRLEREAATRETVVERLAVYQASVPVEESPIPGLVHDHFLRAEAVLQRLESETSSAQSPPDTSAADPVRAYEPPSVPTTSAIVVDEGLLENLNLAAAEIRGARSRAEANLGSLRGGLQDMERTIKSLRAQLEALEVDSSAATTTNDAFDRPQEHGVPARLGALSRGIEELQGLQDALHALTEDTETVLASQASEDSELEHGLLKTRLVPVSTQFQRWRDSVGEAASARLDAGGGEVMLERRQAAALSDALVPLLRACTVDAGAPYVAIDVSRPRFDVMLQIRAAGAAPMTPSAWSALAAGFEPLGAVASRVENEETLSCCIVVPGPPQSVEVLLVGVGGQRFALPVAGVAGVLHRPQIAEADFADDAEAERANLAALLG
ncbi:MAG TPA: hypothetical protein VIT83_06655, partial [Gammaproteobacteria bacterium]